MPNATPYSYAELLNQILSADLGSLRLLSQELKKNRQYYTQENYSELLLRISKRLMDLRLTALV